MQSTLLVLAAVGVMAQSYDAPPPPAEYKIPYGVDLPEGAGPYGAPCDECLDVYHPPHYGVDIDDCDADDDEDWHWVHPGEPLYPEQPPYVWTTSTVTQVHTTTVIHCEDDVPYCPAQSTHYTTVDVPATVTICPVPVPSESYVPPPPPTYALPPPVETTKTHTSAEETKTTEPHHTSYPETHSTSHVHTPYPLPSVYYPPPPPDHGEPSTYPAPPATSSVVYPPPGTPSAVYPPPATPPAAYPPPASEPPYVCHGHTLCPAPSPVNPGTTGIPNPPGPTYPPPAVTAGAAHNAGRIGAAVLVGLLVAFI